MVQKLQQSQRILSRLNTRIQWDEEWLRLADTRPSTQAG